VPGKSAPPCSEIKITKEQINKLIKRKRRRRKREEK